MNNFPKLLPTVHTLLVIWLGIQGRGLSLPYATCHWFPMRKCPELEASAQAATSARGHIELFCLLSRCANFTAGWSEIEPNFWVHKPCATCTCCRLTRARWHSALIAASPDCKDNWYKIEKFSFSRATCIPCNAPKLGHDQEQLDPQVSSDQDFLKYLVSSQLWRTKLENTSEMDWNVELQFRQQERFKTLPIIPHLNPAQASSKVDFVITRGSDEITVMVRVQIARCPAVAKVKRKGKHFMQIITRTTTPDGRIREDIF